MSSSHEPLPKGASAGLAALLHSSEYADLILDVHGVEIKAHRAIVCQRSPVIKAACNGPFKEAQDRRIPMGADTATVASVKRMLQYLYTDRYIDMDENEYSGSGVTADGAGECAGLEDIRRWVAGIPGRYSTTFTSEGGPYSPIKKRKRSTHDSILTPARTKASVTTPRSTLMNNVHVYCLADYYQVFDLKEVAKQMYALALRNAAVYGFQAVVMEHTADNDEMQAITVQHVAAHHSDFDREEAFMAEVSQIPEFMISYVRALANLHHAREVKHAAESEGKDAKLEIQRLEHTAELRKKEGERQRDVGMKMRDIRTLAAQVRMLKACETKEEMRRISRDFDLFE